jgi:hypothetical protein
MSIGTILSWLAVLLIMTMIDPTNSEILIFIIFYLSIFMAITGMFSILGLISRVFILKKHFPLTQQVVTSFRQAVILSGLLTGLLLLQSKAMLTWWNFILLIIIITSIESIFLTTKKPAK